MQRLQFSRGLLFIIPQLDGEDRHCKVCGFNCVSSVCFSEKKSLKLCFVRLHGIWVVMQLCCCVCYRWYYIVVVPVNPASLRRWENPEDMDIHEVNGHVPILAM